MPQDYRYEYLLAKSVVRISARVYEVSDPVLGTTQADVDATAELMTIADQAAVTSTTIPSSAAASTSSSLVYRDDRRLESIDASFTGQGPSRLKAAVSVGGVLLGAALATVSPAAGAAVAMSSLSGLSRGHSVGVRGSVRSFDDAAVDFRIDDPVLVAYARKHPAEAEALAGYRGALLQLSRQHAQEAAHADIDVDELSRLSKALRLVRAQASLLEDDLAGWHLDQVSRRLRRIVVEDLDVEDLPSSDELIRTLNTRDITDLSDRELRIDTPWVKHARDLGLAISVDPITTADLSVGASTGEIKVSYRPGREVRVTTWSVERLTGLTEWLGNGETVDIDAHYVATPTEMIRTRIADAASSPRVLGLDISAWSNGKLSVKFNEVGEPIEIGGEDTTLAAEAVQTIGDSLKTSLETGSAISQALAPGSATAKSVERQLQIAKNRKELAPFLTVSSPDPEAEALTALKESVEIAELEMRLQIAKMQQLRTSARVVYNFGG